MSSCTWEYAENYLPRDPDIPEYHPGIFTSSFRTQQRIEFLNFYQKEFEGQGLKQKETAGWLTLCESEKTFNVANSVSESRKAEVN